MPLAQSMNQVRRMDGFFARTVPQDGVLNGGGSEIRCLYVWPIYTAETLDHVLIELDYVTDVSQGTGTNTSPDAIIPVDLYALSIPDTLMTSGMRNAAGVIERDIRMPETWAELDSRFEHLLFQPFDEGVEYWDTAERQRLEPGDATDQADSVQTDSIGGNDGQDNTMGPLGVVRHFSQEGFAASRLMEGPDRTQFGGRMHMRLNCGRPGMSYLFLGVRRRQWQANGEVPNWLPTTDAKFSALDHLRGGDVQNIRLALGRHGDVLANTLREALFQGDPNAIAADHGFVARDLRFRAMFTAFYSSPYQDYVI